MPYRCPEVFYSTSKLTGLFEEKNINNILIITDEGIRKFGLLDRMIMHFKHHDINYFIYGHRHIELDLMLSSTARILILGDWINYFSYAVFDGENLFLENFVEGETKL